MPSLSSVRLIGNCEPSTRRMISSVSDAGYIIRRSAHLLPGRRMLRILLRGRDHAFFEKTQLQRLFGNDFRQMACLTAQILDLRRRRCPRRIPRRAFLASLEELLGPFVAQTLRNASSSAQFGNALLALQAVQYNPDLLFCRILFAGRSADVLDDLKAIALLSSWFLSHLHCLLVTLYQKPSPIKPS